MIKSNYLKFKLPFHILIILFFLFDLERFQIWDQIEYSFLQIINSSFEAHTLRILLIGGIILLGELIGYSDIISFNFFLTILLIFNLNILFKIFRTYSKNQLFLYLILLSSIIIPFFQNGRGVITTTGMSLLFYTLTCLPNELKSNIKIVFNLILSFILLNVSSGAFLASIIGVVLFFILLKKSNYLYKKKFLLLISVILVSFPITLIYFNKNLDFYGGSVINMLNHGAGQYFNQLDHIILIPTLLICVIFGLLFISFFYKFKLLSDFFPFFIASLIGLLFGFSSFFTFIYINLILVLLSSRFFKFKNLNIVKLQ